MSRKVLAGAFFLTSIVASILLFTRSLHEKREQDDKVGRITSTLTKLSELLDISVIRYLDPTLVLVINSECEHCQWQVEALHHQKDSLGNTNIIFISIEPQDSLISYLTRVGFDQDDFIAFEKAPELIEKSLGSTSTPQLLVFKDNQLAKHYRGETRVDLILKSLTDEH